MLTSHNARHSKSSILFQFQMSVSNLSSVKTSVDVSVAACCLQFSTFSCPFCNFDFFELCGLPCTHLYPSGSLVRRNLDSYSPSPLLRKIDTLRLGPHFIDNMLRDIVETRLSLSHHVDVFHWDRECFITNEVLHDVD